MDILIYFSSAITGKSIKLSQRTNFHRLVAALTSGEVLPANKRANPFYTEAVAGNLKLASLADFHASGKGS